MTREEFAAQLERGAQQAAQSPVASAVLRWTGEQLKRGEPAWWKGIAKAWEKRRFVAWSEAWGLYLTALHYEALSDAECPLVRFFPSCGGTADADPTPGLAKFLAAPPPSFFENLKNGHRRSYIEARAALWMSPALFYFHRRRLAYYLVEVNAGAGLNLIADGIQSVDAFDSELVAARVGLDPVPLQVEDTGQRRWLTAGVSPDNIPGIVALDKAADKLVALCRGDASLVQLAPCAAEDAPAFVAKNVPAEEAMGLLVYNMGTTVRMTDEEYAVYARGMAETLKPWGDRALWVEAESPRGDPYSSTLQLRAHRLVSGELKTMVMASFDLASGAHQANASMGDFLGPNPGR